MSALFIQCPGDTVQTETEKVDPARKFKCTTAARVMSRFRNISAGFETITGIYINVNFQVFTHKTRYFDKVKYKQNRK